MHSRKEVSWTHEKELSAHILDRSHARPGLHRLPYSQMVESHAIHLWETICQTDPAQEDMDGAAMIKTWHAVVMFAIICCSIIFIVWALGEVLP